MIYLITGTDEKYYPKIYPYLETINKYSAFKNILLCVGFSKDSEFDNITYKSIPKDSLTDITTNPCVQAGEFLPYVSFNDDDIIIFTDGDIRLQRAFTNEELNKVSNVKHDEVLIGPNATHSNNTLLNEANGLNRYCSDEYLNSLFSEYGINKNSATLNVGVIICTTKTYKRIYELTYEIYNKYPKVTDHMARQQWYINCAIYSFCNVSLLPFSFHSHPHNGSQPDMSFEADHTMYVNGERVLFRHKYYV
jgi:hypothetical protein